MTRRQTLAARWRRIEDAALGPLLALEHRVRKLPPGVRLSASPLDRVVFRGLSAALALMVAAFLLPSRRARVIATLFLLLLLLGGFLVVVWRDAQPGRSNRV